jgi:GNAT superfamily N-acetyltransferase
MTTSTDGKTIRRAQAAEATRLGSLIADAFHHLPVSAAVAAEPDERRATMAGQFEILIGHAIAYGDVYVVDGPGRELAAVAAWFRPGEIPDIERYDERLASACGLLTPRFVELDALMHERHPAEPPHAYLAFLAVRSRFQNHGLGSALLTAYHPGLDATGTAAYLEASSPRSRALYTRHGYVDHGPVYGLDGGEHFWPMWREPR